MATIPTYNAGLLTWNARVGSCEASDLHDPAQPNASFMGGFNLVSPKTGECLTFRFVRASKNQENEVEFWVFQSGAVKVRIYND